MYVCMYACMYVCMYVCAYVYMYACMYVRLQSDNQLNTRMRRVRNARNELYGLTVGSCNVCPMTRLRPGMVRGREGGRG